MSERPAARIHMAQIAEANGWERKRYNTADWYVRGEDTVAFGWAQEGRAAELVTHQGKRLDGPMALVDARRILESSV